MGTEIDLVGAATTAFELFKDGQLNTSLNGHSADTSKFNVIYGDSSLKETIRLGCVVHIAASQGTYCGDILDDEPIEIEAVNLGDIIISYEFGLKSSTNDGFFPSKVILYVEPQVVPRSFLEIDGKITFTAENYKNDNDSLFSVIPNSSCNVQSNKGPCSGGVVNFSLIISVNIPKTVALFQKFNQFMNDTIVLQTNPFVNPCGLYPAYQQGHWHTIISGQIFGDGSVRNLTQQVNGIEYMSRYDDFIQTVYKDGKIISGMEPFAYQK
jgi:hypothetical protein